jgi:DNA-binding MarR family transcriptional regulator
MKAEGLITSEQNQEDKRFTMVRLTDKGRDLFVKATAVARSVVNELMSGIGKRQAVQLERLLNLLKRNTIEATGSRGSPNKAFPSK